MSLEIAIVLLLIVFFAGCGVGALLRGRTPAKAEETTQAATTSAMEKKPTTRRAAIIFNPTKNGMDTLNAVAETVCRNEGWDPPLLLETTENDPGESMAREAVESGAEVVVAAGGDGTVRAVAQALEGTDVPLGIIPMGTGNLLARNLAIPTDGFEWALRVALWGQNTVIDAGRIRTRPDADFMVFTVMAGLGYDAAVMQGTSEKEKSRIGWLAYVKSGSRKLAGKPTAVRMQFDDKPAVSTRVRSVLGGNCGKVQGGIQLIPGAKFDDGYLDVLSVTPANIAQWAGVVTSILGKSRKGPHTSVTRCTTVTIRAEDELDVQVDGDVLGRTRYVELAISPAALTVRTPSPEQVRRMRADRLGLG